MEKFLVQCFPIWTLSRGIRTARHVRPYLRDLYLRRIIQGPEKFRPRSAWKPWNYDSELYAFCHRINEDITPETLRICFTDTSFAAYTSKGNFDHNSADNLVLAREGRRLSESYITGFLRKLYPRLPEEWIVSIREKLLSDSELALIGAHLGITDLLRYTHEKEPTEESPLTPPVTAPPPLKSIATSLLAVIGSLPGSTEAKHLFVRDFILARLLHLEFCADFDFPLIDEPFTLLEGILRLENRGPPEARLQRQSSMNTLLACYQVGIYSDQQLVGEAPGETMEIAEKEAACQALRNLFGIHDSCSPLPLNGPYVPVDGVPLNPTLKDYIGG